jgi:small GTP-binding protein
MSSDVVNLSNLCQQMAMTDPRSFKVVLLGNSGAGKTSLLQYALKSAPFASPQPTIGCNCSLLVVETATEAVSLSIWDTAGQELYRSIVPIYVRDAAAGILVYDVTDPRSFQSLQHWTTVLQEEANVLVYIAGNKVDLEDRATVSVEQARPFADKIGAKLFQVSAADGTGVSVLFKQVATDVAEHGKRAVFSVHSGDVSRSGGCCLK